MDFKLGLLMGLLALRHAVGFCAMANSIYVHKNMSQRISKETWEQVKVAHASGVGLREIARNMNISEGTVLAYAKRHGWTRQIQTVRQATSAHPNAITPAVAAANVLTARKEKSRLHLSKYVEDASRTAANSDGDLEIARNVKDVASVHSTIWPAEPQRGSGVVSPLSVYSRQTVIAVRTKADS
jgi:hypothetical protein